MRFVAPSRKDVFIALFLYALNVFDMIATLYAMGKGVPEANPIMRLLLMYGAAPFVAYKTLGVGALMLFLLYLPLSRRVNVVLLFLSGVYFMLTLYHFWGIRG